MFDNLAHEVLHEPRQQRLISILIVQGQSLKFSHEILHCTSLTVKGPVVIKLDIEDMRVFVQEFGSRCDPLLFVLFVFLFSVPLVSKCFNDSKLLDGLVFYS